MSLLDNASLVLTPNAYKEGKLYSVIPSNGNGDFTVTRATTATRVNSSGLVDLVPYNLLQYSEQFDNVVWGKLGGSSVIANQAIAPNGTMTADLITEGTSVLVYNTILYPAGTYTQSYYAKKGTGDIFGMYFGGSFAARFNLTLGTIISTTNTTATIQDVGNGWYRCTATATPTADFYAGINYVNSTGLTVYAWGAQLVEGTSARDYLRTETRLNIPRLDYSLGGCPNILLEPQRTNLALQSSSFDNASWTKLNGSITANTTTSPSGIADADKIVEDATNNFHGVLQAVTTTSGVTCNVSFYAKASERGYIQWNNQVNNEFANFDLISGVIGTSSGVTNHQIQSVGNGWYRCSLNFVPTVTGTAGFFRLVIVTSASAVRLQNYAGDGTSGLFLWGTQFEAGAYATSYIPTTTASVTRNDDTLTRNNIFTNGLITAAGGTWFVELRNNIVRTRDNSSAGVGIGSTSGLSINALYIRQDTATGRNAILKRISGANTSLFTTTTDIAKIAIKWNGSTADVFQNGVKVVSATAFTPTVLEWIVCNSTDTPKFINEMALFPTPLTDAECIALTA